MKATKVGKRPARRWMGLLAGVVAVATCLWATGFMERMFYYPDAGRPSPPSGLVVEEVEFRSGDGTRLHGWMLPAAGEAAGAAASVLFVHGNAGNLEDHVGMVEHLPAAGFNVFMFDYRGYGLSEGSARRRGPLIADTHAALDTMLARDDVDASRVGLVGQSLGGGIALVVAADRPEIRAVVVESAFTSWRDMAAAGIGGDPPNIVARGLAALLIRDTCRPEDAIRTLARPVLILHGDADDTVPVSHGRRLAAAAPDATYLELAGGDHNSLRWSHAEVDEAVVGFLRTHLAEDDRGH